MSKEYQGCILWAIFILITLAIIIIVVGQRVVEKQACIAGGYADTSDFNGTIVCVGIRDGAYTIEGLDSVRLRLGLERGR